MEDWRRLCEVMSVLFEQDKTMNFGISLSPDEVEKYLLTKTIHARIVDDLTAALFITIDGECGFVAPTISKAGYKFLVSEFKAFVIKLPDELQHKLWCKVQNNNSIIQRLAVRLGFVLDKKTETASYYLYKGD